MAASDVLKRVPIPICGLALGLASLDRFLDSHFDVYSLNMLALISAFLVAIITVKALLFPSEVRKELMSPVIYGVAPTYCMTLMVLSTYVQPHADALGFAMWSGAILLFALMIIGFTGRFLTDFRMGNVFPSWFVVFVGYVVAAMTSPAFGMESFGKALFCAGLLCYAALLPIILYRVVRMPVPKAARPNIAIFAAPANLCIAGYFACFADLNGIVVMILAIFGIIGYAAVLCYMPIMLNSEFYPSFAAFTFPMVISTVSLDLLFTYYDITGIVADVVLTASILFSIAMVMYVLIRYIMHICNVRVGSVGS